MADNTYIVEDFLSGTVPFDDGTGIDWIVVSGTYAAPFGAGSYGATITMYFETPDRIEFSVSVVSGSLLVTSFGGVSGTIENAQGGGGAERIEGNGLANLISGDPLDVAGGNDALYGRGGADQILGAGGSDQIFGGTDNDILFGDGDPFSQDLGNYMPGDDTLHGDEGNDTVYGGWGSNSLFGDEGYDTADYSGFFDDFGNTVYRIDAYLNSGTVTVFGRDTFGGPEFVVATDSLAGFEAIIGTSGGDLIFGRWVFGPGEPPGNEIHGGAGNDTLTGSTGADALYGGTGVDVLDDYDSTMPGLTGVDLLSGGADDDYYQVRATTTVIVEGETGGYDRVTSNVSYALPDWVEALVISSFAGASSGTGNAIDNTLEGNSSANDLSGLAGNDYVTGWQGNDTLRGGLGADSLYGGTEADLLIGSAQSDVLQGAAGADSLNGGSENDQLYGGSQADTLQGGLGRDVLRGGSGRDTFFFASAAETPGRGLRDTIEDFTTGQDLIDLHRMAKTQTFIGATAFNATGAAEVRYDPLSGLLTGDTDGNGTTDFQIALGLGTALTGGDLIL